MLSLRTAPDLGDVLGLLGQMGWVAQVLAQLSACLWVIVDDLAAEVDPAEASRRWVQRLRAVIATIERVAGSPHLDTFAALTSLPALDVPDGTAAWDFGNAFTVLTDQQAAVVSLLLHGFRPAQISEQLHIAKGTLRSHRRDAVKRLRAEGSPGALKLAQRCVRFERTHHE